MVGNQFFPRRFFINAITNAQNAVVTFTEDHDYLVGEIVSFRVTKDFGMQEINQIKGKVLSLTSDTVTVDIDTTTWTAFDYSVLDNAGTTPPCCVPVGSGIVENNDVSETIFADAFDNRRI